MKLLSLTVLLIFVCNAASAQTPAPPPPAADSGKIVHILSSQRYGYKRLDSLTELLLLVGKVALRQENTIFYADSAVYNKNAKVVEAFRNVHINDNDSVHTYSDYLLYHTDTKIAILKKNVRLTDSKSTLFTEELEYDVNQKVGIYRNGGKLLSGTSTLTSGEGTYYSDVKEVYFKKNVKLVDPKYKLESDSLLYNTDTEIATFITKTFIEDSAKRSIVTREGYYDLKNKNASFGARPIIRDGAVTIIANQVDTDDNTGISILTGNAVFKDTAQGVSVLANSIVNNKITGRMLATQKPLLIIVQDKDSTFVSSDTLYSGRLDELVMDSIASAKALDSIGDSSAIKISDSVSAQAGNINDTASQKSLVNRPVADSAKPDAVSSSLPLRPSPLSPGGQQGADSVNVSAKAIAHDSGIATQVTNVNDTANRYFRAYRNVRIFSDSLQAVCDSLFYSGKDSIFRLFRDPIVWSGNGDSQVTGDTIFMYTKNKKPHELHVFENGLMVNQSGEQMFNQIKGNRIFGYFTAGELDYVRAKGNAECIYYAKDEEGRLVGINKANSDIIDMRFKQKELNKVVFISEVTGSMLPFRTATEQDKKLRNFKWHEDRRPKSKFELFGN